MSLLTYKILHLFGIFLLFTALGGLTLRSADGGERSRLAGISHGVALLVILVSGFGLLARLGLSHDWAWPTWVWLKLTVWLLLGASLVLVRRLPRLRNLWWCLFPLLGAAAAYLALFKPTF